MGALPQVAILKAVEVLGCDSDSQFHGHKMFTLGSLFFFCAILS